MKRGGVDVGEHPLHRKPTRHFSQIQNIPASPKRAYGGDGWAGMGDWLGTGRIADQERQYRTFKKARAFDADVCHAKVFEHYYPNGRWKEELRKSYKGDWVLGEDPKGKLFLQIYR